MERSELLHTINCLPLTSPNTVATVENLVKAGVDRVVAEIQSPDGSTRSVSALELFLDVYDQNKTKRNTWCSIDHANVRKVFFAILEVDGEGIRTRKDHNGVTLLNRVIMTGDPVMANEATKCLLSQRADADSQQADADSED